MQIKSLFTLCLQRVLFLVGITSLVGVFFVQALPVSADNSAFVRVVHASPVAGNVDVFVDGNRLLSNFAFGTVTGYVTVPAGAHRIQVAPAGKGINGSVINQTVSVAAGMPYTVAAVGTDANTLGLQAFVDNNLLSGAGTQAKVRVYHLSPNAGPVNVAAGGSTVITGLTYKNASDYLMVPAGAYTFNVTATQANATVPVNATLTAGTVNSVFAVGLFQGTPALKFVLATVNGVPGMPQTGSDPAATAANSSTNSTPLPWVLGIVGVALLGTSLAVRRFALARHK